MRRQSTCVALTGALLVIVASCGGHTGAAQQDGGVTDGAGADQLGGDATPDGVAPDGPPGDASLDAPPGDGGVMSAPQFVGETAGGGRRTSAHYRLDVFVAPVRPVGSRSGTSYQLRLGPGAVSNAR